MTSSGSSCTTIADVSGDYLCTLSSSVIDGEDITIITTDIAGNTEIAEISIKETSSKKGSRRVSQAKLAEIFGKKETTQKELETEDKGKNTNSECSINYYRLIKKGLFGSDVQEVQQCLLNMGFPLPIFGADGWYGAETYNQISTYQRSKGLKYIDGIVGPETLKSLNLNNF